MYRKRPADNPGTVFFAIYFESYAFGEVSPAGVWLKPNSPQFKPSLHSSRFARRLSSGFLYVFFIRFPLS